MFSLFDTNIGCKRKITSIERYLNDIEYFTTDIDLGGYRVEATIHTESLSIEQVNGRDTIIIHRNWYIIDVPVFTKGEGVSCWWSGRQTSLLAIHQLCRQGGLPNQRQICRSKLQALLCWGGKEAARPEAIESYGNNTKCHWSVVWTLGSSSYRRPKFFKSHTSHLLGPQ